MTVLCTQCQWQPVTGQEGSAAALISCPSCGAALLERDILTPTRGFLARLGRFGLGLGHHPLFRDRRKGSGAQSTPEREGSGG